MVEIFFVDYLLKLIHIKEVNPENMCNLIHFLIQQASLNNKSITFTKGIKQKIRFSNSIDFICSGMFVIFDSTNTIFEQLMKAKDEQKSGDDAKHSGYFKRLKYMGHQAIQDLLKDSQNNSDTFIYVRGDESSHYHGERGSKMGSNTRLSCLWNGYSRSLYVFDFHSNKKNENLFFQVCLVALVIFFLVNFLQWKIMGNMLVNVFI